MMKANRKNHFRKKNGIPPKNGPKPPPVILPPGPNAIERPTAKPLVKPPPCGPTLPPATTGLASDNPIVIIINPAIKILIIYKSTEQESRIFHR